MFDESVKMKPAPNEAVTLSIIPVLTFASEMPATDGTLVMVTLDPETVTTPDNVELFTVIIEPFIDTPGLMIEFCKVIVLLFAFVRLIPLLDNVPLIKLTLSNKTLLNILLDQIL
ncbi:MAG: hypothetical protein PHW24_02350 [Candidatus Moranbacteria bacterium]|nr:hypothetical protein [Candidatus Moranbacteria bacterium]